MNLSKLCASVLVTFGVLSGTQAFAQAYPTNPVTIVVPYAAGGATDVIARMVGQKLSDKWGQPVIVNNRPGAGTAIGAESVVRAPADGYTLYMTTAAHTISASLYKKLSYDPIKDFAPISLTSVVPLVLVASPKLPAHTLQELIQYAKANPGVTYGSPGNGSPQHLTGALFKSQTKLDLIHVPYKGDAPMLNDLLGGQVQTAFVTLSAAIPHIKSGKINAIALAHPKRIDAIDKVPTFTEAGMSGFEAATWFGLFSSASVPADLQNKIYQDVSTIVATPEIRGKIQDIGGEIVNSSPMNFSAFIQKESKRWAEAVQISGAQVD
ncbi:tripartite tricarboxylate transporter substrate binding protein [Noviherbaspirillum sp. 1P10PC]|uniref:tripartite tricarboxylate transporter substrate binding protein n=1 Tax=Noviherbaspirillum sp. 1P10PC TaxID=3132292 RepID=UPI0039A15163